MKRAREGVCEREAARQRDTERREYAEKVTLFVGFGVGFGVRIATGFLVGLLAKVQ